jgi:hypothetical protein
MRFATAYVCKGIVPSSGQRVEAPDRINVMSIIGGRKRAAGTFVDPAMLE